MRFSIGFSTHDLVQRYILHLLMRTYSYDKKLVPDDILVNICEVELFIFIIKVQCNGIVKIWQW